MLGSVMHVVMTQSAKVMLLEDFKERELFYPCSTCQLALTIYCLTDIRYGDRLALCTY